MVIGLKVSYDLQIRAWLEEGCVVAKELKVFYGPADTRWMKDVAVRGGDTRVSAEL